MECSSEVCVCVLAALQHHSQTATWERSQQSSWERSQVAWSEHYTIYNAAIRTCSFIYIDDIYGRYHPALSGLVTT